MSKQEDTIIKTIETCSTIIYKIISGTKPQDITAQMDQLQATTTDPKDNKNILSTHNTRTPIMYEELQHKLKTHNTNHKNEIMTITEPYQYEPVKQNIQSNEKSNQHIVHKQIEDSISYTKRNNH